MSKNIGLPIAGDIIAEWLELDFQIYTGPESGYSEAIHIGENSTARSGSVTCKAFWHEDGHWGFIFEGGHVCLIDDNRVRYVKGRLRSAVEAETERDDVMAVENGAKQLADDITHIENVAPKRRGRPPKVRE